jgi:hypothetical protein
MALAAATSSFAVAKSPKSGTSRDKVPARTMAITITKENAAKVAHQVWLNETGGNLDAMTSWNPSESFASLGIGHFIWFPAGLDARFEESFPGMIRSLKRHGATPPDWLDKDPVPDCPWKSKVEFDRAFHAPRMTELRQYLIATMDLQAQFLVLRLRNALPRILADLPDGAERGHVKQQFARVVSASPDLYPLIDYVNFKGEGVSDSEVFPNRTSGKPEGWGLKHVLLAMTGTSPDRDKVLREFSAAARMVLLRRIANNPTDRIWQRNWLARVEGYSRPLR